MRFFQNRHMDQVLIHLFQIHPVFLQFHYQNSHQERFRFRRADSAQINNGVLFKECFQWHFFFGAEDLTIDAVCQRLHTRDQCA